VHFIRLVISQGQVKIFNELWTVGEQWVGEYIWTTISTAVCFKRP